MKSVRRNPLVVHLGPLPWQPPHLAPGVPRVLELDALARPAAEEEEDQSKHLRSQAGVENGTVRPGTGKSVPHDATPRAMSLMPEANAQASHISIVI